MVKIIDKIIGKVKSILYDGDGNVIDDSNPLPTADQNRLIITNAIDETAFDLNASSFSETTDISNDFILDSLVMNFSTDEAKTITVTGPDGTILWGGDVDQTCKNPGYNTTKQNFNITFNQAFDGGDNITVSITQFSSAGTCDVVLKVKQGNTEISGGDIVLGAGDETIGRVKITDGTEVANVSTTNKLETETTELSNFAFSVGTGLVSGTSSTFLTFIDIDVQTTFNDVWDESGDLVYPTSAESWEMLSDDVNDTSAGTGARLVSITTFDANNDLQTQTVTMDGTTPVNLTGTHLLVRSIAAISSGSSGWNEGNITVRPQGGGNTRTKILPTNCTSYNGFYRVPNGKLGAPYNVLINCGKNTDLETEYRVRIAGTDTWFRINAYEFYMGLVDFRNETISFLPPGSDIRVRAKAGSAGKIFNGVFEIYEVDVT